MLCRNITCNISIAATLAILSTIAEVLMARNSKEALKIARQIVELEMRIEPLKQELAALQKQFEAMVTGDEADFETSRAGSPANLTLKLKEIFKEASGETISIQELLQKIPEAQASTLRSTLSRLVKDEFVQSVDRGQYRYSGDSEEEFTF